MRWMRRCTYYHYAVCRVVDVWIEFDNGISRLLCDNMALVTVVAMAWLLTLPD